MASPDPEALAVASPQDPHDLWIFGYGSLMWKPGFGFSHAVRARLTGFHRSFCIYSTHHRGSAARPGLVLGLDRGGVCDGVLYQVAASKRASTLAYLREREQVNGVYREAEVGVVECAPGHLHRSAKTYIVEPAHPSYAGRLAPLTQAHLIRAARGISGANLDYLINTLQHLNQLGIAEPELRRVLTLSGALFARAAAATTDPQGLVRPSRLAHADTARAGVKALGAMLQTLPVTAPLMPPLERRRFGYRRQLAVSSGNQS